MRVSPTNILRIVGTHLKEIAGFGSPSLEGFRLELARLELLGRSFGPLDYARALEEHLGIRIVVEDFPDTRLALARRGVLEEGTLAEVSYAEERGEALILVRESLRMRPWPAYELALYHELSHLAARHPLRLKDGEEGSPIRKPARILARAARILRRRTDERGRPRDDTGLRERVYEPEAKRRARWLVLAGEYPTFFEREGADRLA